MDRAYDKDGGFIATGEMNPGELFKYVCFHENLKTGKKKRVPIQQRFFNHAAFRACLKLWNEQGQRHDVHRWRYEPAKL